LAFYNAVGNQGLGIGLITSKPLDNCNRPSGPFWGVQFRRAGLAGD
jgi:hypothetical protein